MNYQPRPVRPSPALRLPAVLFAAGLAVSPFAAPTIAFARPAPDGFADLVEQVGPAVVQIMTKHSANGDPTAGNPSLPDGLAEGPMRNFFEHFFGDRAPIPGQPGDRQPGRQMGLGSGFIATSDGTIVTNNHVVDGADSITVRLKDGREFPAKLVGADSKTDLAVLKITTTQPLPTLGWGDSDHARVGDWVVAVGNPFGLEGTVTAGIISSRGRDTGASPYVDFMQIDAPLNSGNSGGPLLNDDGEVIGVNTAIVSPNGGSVGIGFAIPSDTAKAVVAQLEAKGQVDRGWLGVAIQPVTPEVADSLGLPAAKGALIATVSPDSPAQKAGLRQGDVVLDFDGHAIASPRDLSRVVADAEQGSHKTIAVWRGTETKTLKVAIGETPKAQVAANETKPAAENAKGSVDLAALGLSVGEARTKSLRSSGNEGGVMITGVDPNGEAAEKGIHAGDVLLRVNDQEVTSPHDVVKALDQAKSENRKAVLLLIENTNGTHFVPVKLASA